MPKKSWIDQLPLDIQRKVIKAYHDHGFGRYAELEEVIATLLEDEGYELTVGTRSIAGLGKKLESFLPELREWEEKFKMIPQDGGIENSLMVMAHMKLLKQMSREDLTFEQDMSLVGTSAKVTMSSMRQREIRQELAVAFYEQMKKEAVDGAVAMDKVRASINEIYGVNV